MHEEIDNELRVAFRESEIDLPDEPFLSRSTELIRSARRRRSVVGWILRALVIVVVAAASPWLVGASVWFSDRLGTAFAAADAFFGTSLGMILVAVCTLPLVFLNRKRIF